MHLGIIKGLGPVREHNICEGEVQQGVQDAQADGDIFEFPAQGAELGIIFSYKYIYEINKGQENGVDKKDTIIAEDSFRFLRSSYICANGKSRKAKVYISITFSREKCDTLEAVRDGMPSNGKSGASALRGGGNECEKQDIGD